MSHIPDVDAELGHVYSLVAYHGTRYLPCAIGRRPCKDILLT